MLGFWLAVLAAGLLLWLPAGMSGTTPAQAQGWPACAAKPACGSGQSARCKSSGNCMEGKSRILNGCRRYACEATGAPTPNCAKAPACGNGGAPECKRMALCSTSPGNLSTNKRCVEWVCKAPPPKMIPTCATAPTCRLDERPACQMQGSCMDRSRVTPRVSSGCTQWLCKRRFIEAPRLPKRPVPGPGEGKGKGPVLR